MQSIEGVFRGWFPDKRYGFITPADGSPDVFLHMSAVPNATELLSGTRIAFRVEIGAKGRHATEVTILGSAAEQLIDTGSLSSRSRPATSDEQNALVLLQDDDLLSEDIEELDTTNVRLGLLDEIACWKREAKAEDNDRYFWHVREADEIAQGHKYFIIGRKGSGKTAICEYFTRQRKFDVFAEKLSFKNFPFNDLYSHKNPHFTSPNQFITIWKYLIYSTICRLMLRNHALEEPLRQQLSSLYADETSLSRRIGRWVGKEFGISLFGLSVISNQLPPGAPHNWTEHVDFLEDLLSQYAGNATYFVLFDELDEDYRDVIESKQHEQYTALITSLFKAVQDVRTTFSDDKRIRLYPVVFLRDDIYEIVQDSDKNRWGDFRVDLDWDTDKIKKLIAFRISRALDAQCTSILPFEDAWSRVFGSRPIGIGGRRRRLVSTFEFIGRSTLLRPRDFVSYLQNCAQHAVENEGKVSPDIVRAVDKAFSNYLRQELIDELFAVLPDIANIFDAISQLRKWNFSIPELELAYLEQVDRGFIKQRNVKFVLQVLLLFSVIGNIIPRGGWYVFRYQNREARLNFNERVVVHRGLFKALQIL